MERVIGGDYTVATFFENLGQHGLGRAISWDWSSTKKHLGIKTLKASECTGAREVEDVYHIDDKVIVNFPTCHDCNSPTIARKGVVLDYLGRENPSGGLVKGYLENRYLVKLRDGKVTCFESNLEKA